MNVTALIMKFHIPAKNPNTHFLFTLQAPKRNGNSYKKKKLYMNTVFQNLSSSQSVQHILVSFPLPENHSICALYPQDNAQEHIQVSGEGSISRRHSSSKLDAHPISTQCGPGQSHLGSWCSNYSYQFRIQEVGLGICVLI